MQGKIKYKIVQLSSVHASIDTRIFYKISTSLVSYGFEVDLIIQHHKDEILNGIHLKSLPIAKRKIDRLLKIIPTLFIKCIKYPPNTIFHFHDPELLPIGFILKKFGYKVIYDVHEDVPKSIISKSWIPKPFRSILFNVISWLENKAVSYFDGIIVVTKTIQNRLDGKNTKLIQNYPIVHSVKQYKEGHVIDNTRKNKVFYLGSITAIRGLKEDIMAINIVNQFADVELILGGSFAPASLKQILMQEEGWRFVNFVDWISRKDIKKYTDQSFAGLVTFHPEPNHLEAQPNKLFEYMYAGLPVVASNFERWREIVDKNECGLLVDPLSPEEIAKAILWLYQNPDEAKRMGENGRIAVEKKYNWGVEEVKLINMYTALMSEN